MRFGSLWIWLWVFVACAVRRFGEGAPTESPTSGSSGPITCMTGWLTISGTSSDNLNKMETKARRFQLSETAIRDVLHLPILKALLPPNVATKLRTCTQNVTVCGRQSPCGLGRCEFNTTTSRHFCQCPSGLFGEKCENDVDECSRGQHSCDVAERAFCNNTHGSYVCQCRHGYCGENGRHCQDVDECEDGSHSCHDNATCTNMIGSYSCSCFEGFRGDGLNCQEVICSGESPKSKLCQQVEFMREQLHLIPRLEKKLDEQEILLQRTNRNVLTLSKALVDSNTRIEQALLISNRTSNLEGCHGIAAWKYYPWVNWADHQNDGELKSVTYKKERNDTTLRVAFHTTLGQYYHGRCSEWYIQFNGRDCTQPAPIVTSIYTHHSDASSSWSMTPAEVSGFCNSTSQGKLSKGNIVISINVKRACNKADAYSGKFSNGKVTSYLIVEEYC